MKLAHVLGELTRELGQAGMAMLSSEGSPRRQGEKPDSHAMSTSHSWSRMTTKLSSVSYNICNNPATEALAYDFNYAHSIHMTGITILPSVGVHGEF